MYSDYNFQKFITFLYLVRFDRQISSFATLIRGAVVEGLRRQDCRSQGLRFETPHATLMSFGKTLIYGLPTLTPGDVNRVPWQ